MEENQCIFCQIASGAIKSSIVYQDQNLLGILDINPATVGHVILMPRAHYNSLYEMPPPLSLGLLSIARAIGYALLLHMGSTNVDLIYSQELRQGNFTPHALIHIIPRYKDDNVNYAWQSRSLTEEEIAQISQSVIGAIEKVGNQEAPSTPPPPAQAPPPSPRPAPQPQEPKKEEKPLELKKKVVIF